MKKAPLTQPTEPPSTNGMKTMTAIVQDEYGTAPEQVLRLAEIARPAMCPLPKLLAGHRGQQ